MFYKVINRKKNVTFFEANEDLFSVKIMLWSVLFWYCKVVLGISINKMGTQFNLSFSFLLFIEEISNANLGSIELIKDPLDDPKLPLMPLLKLRSSSRSLLTLFVS